MSLHVLNHQSTQYLYLYQQVVSSSHYETIQLRIQGGDGVRGTRAQVDATITTAVQELSSLCIISGEGHLLDSTLSLPPPRSKDIDPVYTEAVTVPGVYLSPATEGVVYDDIKAFQNKDVQCVCLLLRYFGDSFLFQGQQYAIISNLKTTGKLVDDPNLTVYSEIQHVLSSQQVQITEITSRTKSTTQLKQGTYNFLRSRLVS